MSDDGPSGRMTRRTTIKTGIAIGAAAMTGTPLLLRLLHPPQLPIR